MSVDILRFGVQLTMFEIDPAYCEWLRKYFEASAFKLLQGDVVKTWSQEWSRNPPQRIFGNLPYNAASPIIASFIGTRHIAPLSVFSVQDELGQRMMARPGGKDYSSFSIMCQAAVQIEDCGSLSPFSFYPVPKVKSRIVSIRPGTACGTIDNPEQFSIILRSMFTSRRKTLSNNIAASSRIKGYPVAEKMREAFASEGIDIQRRPETVAPCEWVSVANRVADC